MDATEQVMTFITALQSGDMGLAASMLADDFVLHGWSPRAIDKGTFLAMQSNLLAAMPDFMYNLTDEHMADEVVEAQVQISGTQSGNLDLSMLGIAPIEATGLAIELPQVPARFTLENTLVKEMDIAIVDGGGLSGLLQQLGGEIPPTARYVDE